MFPGFTVSNNFLKNDSYVHKRVYIWFLDVFFVFEHFTISIKSSYLQK